MRSQGRDGLMDRSAFWLRRNKGPERTREEEGSYLICFQQPKKGCPLERYFLTLLPSPILVATFMNNKGFRGFPWRNWNKSK